MKKDYKKSMNQKARAKSRSKKILLAGTSIAAGVMLGIIPISMATPLFTIGSQQVHADVISGQLFNNLSTTNTSGTTAAAPFPLQGASRDVDFVISANSGLDVSVINGTRRAVLAIPEEMQGLVTPNGTGTFYTDILLPGNSLAPLLNIVDGAVTTLVGAVEGLINLNPLATVNLSEVYEQLALLNNLSTLTSAEVELQLQMQGDEYIYGELDGALETVIRENLSNILSGINNALAVTVKPAFNLTFNTALALVNVGSSFLGNLADASILGETTVTIPTTIQDPTYADLTNAGVDMTVPYEAGFIGTILKSDLYCFEY